MFPFCLPPYFIFFNLFDFLMHFVQMYQIPWDLNRIQMEDVGAFLELGLLNDVMSRGPAS